MMYVPNAGQETKTKEVYVLIARCILINGNFIIDIQENVKYVILNFPQKVLNVHMSTRTTQKEEVNEGTRLSTGGR